MKRPNAIMFVKGVDDEKYICVYIRDDINKWIGPIGKKYEKTTDVTNLDPFVNWMDYIPNKEWVYPIIANPEGKGWRFKPFDTYNEVRWNNKSTTLNEIYNNNELFLFFNSVLDAYKNMSDEKLLNELNIGRIDKWTKEELE